MKQMLLGLALALAAPALAQGTDEQPKVLARLIVEDSSVRPGGTVIVALEENIRAGWHTYWINPGDAGAPTEIKWVLPPGWKAGAIAWPTPHRLPVGPLMDYGYEGRLWLLSTLTAPAAVSAGQTITLKAAVSWLVCSDECVPESTTLTLPLKIGSGGPNPAFSADFAAAHRQLPIASPWPISYSIAGQTLTVYAASPALAAARPLEATFFPNQSGIVRGTAPQILSFTSGGLLLTLTRDTPLSPVSGPLTGVLVLRSSDDSVQALFINAPGGAVPVADVTTVGTYGRAASPGAGAVLLSMVFAVIGGLILNVMPCVLPILAVKALALTDARPSREAAREGFAYALGAMMSFVTFGLVIAALRRGGAAVGWGFQLQQPAAVGCFALLMFGAALNLSGVFEVRSVTLGDGLTRRSGALGAFFTGILAVAVAAPCTAPFMAVALGVALSLKLVPAMLVFFCLGLGFALPLLLLALLPSARKLLPKPGPWLLSLKQFLAFPMYGSAAWLVWVLAQQSGADGIALVLAAMVTLAFAAWLWTGTRSLSVGGRRVGAVASALMVLASSYCVLTLRTAATASSTVSSNVTAQSFTRTRLATLRAADKPVFVDATAAWCITCLVNEKIVLSQPRVKGAFRDRHVAYLIADWTNRSAEITQLLDANGRSGVPLYLYYAPGADKPVILPQILTPDAVLSAIGL